MPGFLAGERCRGGPTPSNFASPEANPEDGNTLGKVACGEPLLIVASLPKMASLYLG